jgi:hypothetical protein
MALGGTGGSSASVCCVFSEPVYRDQANANRVSTPTTIIVVQTSPYKLARRMNHRGISLRARAKAARPAKPPTARIQTTFPSCGQNVSTTASLAHTPIMKQDNPADRTK